MYPIFIYTQKREEKKTKTKQSQGQQGHALKPIYEHLLCFFLPGLRLAEGSFLLLHGTYHRLQEIWTLFAKVPSN